MNIFIEKFEKRKTPFLSEYNNSNLEFLEKNKDLNSFDLLLNCVIENIHLSKVDEFYKLKSEIDVRYRNRFRSKKEFRKFLPISRRYLALNKRKNLK